MAPVDDVAANLSYHLKRSTLSTRRGHDTVIIEIVMLIICTMLVLNRFHVRFYTGQTAGKDDYVILTSLVTSETLLQGDCILVLANGIQVFCVAMNVVNIVAIHYGYGEPIKELSKHDADIAMKVSITLLYRRIFDTNKFRFKLVCDCVLGFVAAYAVASILVTLFECSPVARIWDRTLPGTCINFTAFWYANAAWNISTDITILLLPMPVIHTLRLPTKSKVGLTAVFTLGIFVCATSILRMTTLDFSSKSHDQSYGTLLSTMWTVIEANTGIICACLPMLRIPLSRLLPRLLPSYWREQFAARREHQWPSGNGLQMNSPAKSNKWAQTSSTGAWLKGNHTETVPEAGRAN
ncbi:hypothetical protein PRK78_006741 [Emydomyces testavorans]|uniref:Rhodopsin domain-containing protein n=1 Tax=Emydomyces testavorans TaxID=2070801 RepID=A0AAF0DPS8_9EURO|nr:hypothetical protein PRK78_006741 [Emydomyces testavorans]